MSSSAPPPLISFDDHNRIRILDSVQFGQIEGIHHESLEFTSKITTFKNTVSNLVDLLQKQALRIEHHKFLAIGLRNEAVSEADNRVKKERDMQALIVHRKAELERYQVYLTSLEKVEQQQKCVAEKLIKPQ